MLRRRRYTYDFPRPMVTVDAAVFRVWNGRREALLVRRGNAPHKGRWALPGGFIGMDESLETSVRRELREETGLDGIRHWTPVGVYGDPKRDPRGRTISVLFLGVVADVAREPRSGDDAAAAHWVPLARLPKRMAFDHARMLRDAVRHLDAMGLCAPRSAASPRGSRRP